MKLLIINPGNPIKSTFSAVEPPVWAGLYADYARKQGHDVKIHDCQEKTFALNGWRPDEAWLMLMGNNPSASSTPKMPDAQRIGQQLVDEGIKVRVGGLHALALPEETVKECHADSVLPMIDMRKYMVAWDLLPMDIYRAHFWHCLHNGDKRDKYASLYTAYGCPYSCDFCNIRQLYGASVWMPRRLRDVIGEVHKLKNVYGIRNLKLCDELFTTSKSRVESICKGLKEYYFNIWCYGRVGAVNDPMLENMAKAGVSWIAYGFESFSPGVRGNKKYQNEDETIRMTREYGMNIMGNFIFGLPGDDLDTMKYTLERAMKYNFEFINFYVYIPYPGCAKWDNKLSHDWSRYSQFSTNPLCKKEVMEFRNKAFIEYLTNPDYQSHISRKFGVKAVEQINSMLNCGKPK